MVINNITVALRYISLAALATLAACQEYEIQEVKEVVTPGPFEPMLMDAPKFADISLSFERHDFGTLEIQDVVLPQNLVISNVGDYDLDISKVEKNCASTSYSISSLQNNVIAPGDSEVLLIGYQASDYGDDNCSLDIYSNDPIDPVVSVLLFARVGIPTLEISPPSLEFSDVDMVLTPSVSDHFVLRNTGDGTLEVSKVEKIYANNDIILGSFPNSKILPGQQELLDVIYYPSSNGQSSEKIKIITNDPVNTTQKVKVEGNTADPDIDTVAGIDFGMIDYGETATKTIKLHNLGKGTLQINGIYFTNSTSTFSIKKGFTGNISPGDYEKIKIEYTPNDYVADSSGIQVISNDPIDPVHIINLNGDVNTPEIEVNPDTIDFGNVDVNAPDPIVTVKVSNVGQGPLDVTSISLKNGNAYSLFNNTPTTLSSGQHFEFDIVYSPTHHSYDYDEVEIVSNDPSSPLSLVIIEGIGSAPQIEVSPDPYDFGLQYLQCLEEQSIDIKNIGDASLEITKIEYYTSFPNHYIIDYDFASNGLLPWNIPPGGMNTVYVSYEPYDVTIDTSFLKIHSNDPSSPISYAYQSGEGDYYATITDSFQQNTVMESDILFVIDNSCSMGSWQTHVANNFDSFMNVFQNSGIDYHIAVITTDDPNFVGPVIDNQAIDPVAEMQAQVKVGISGSPHERGLDQAYYALRPGGDAAQGSGFLRTNAKLSIIFVSDEPDYSNYFLNKLDYAVEFSNSKSIPNKVVAHAIAGDYPGGCAYTSPTVTWNVFASYGRGYHEVVDDMGGSFLSICDSDWGLKMETLAKDSIVKSSFKLSDIAVPSSIEVLVDGSVTTAWVYDVASNTVVFDPGSVPSIGSTIDITYSILGGC